MNTEKNNWGIVLLISAVIGFIIGYYLSFFLGSILFILIHLLFTLYKKERLSSLIWILFSASLVLPFVLLIVAQSNPEFYQVLGSHMGHRFFSNLDSLYAIYGGTLLSLLCIGFIYQQTSFYHIGFGKGGGGFFIMAGLAGILAIMEYYKVFGWIS